VPDPDEISSRIGARTKAILLNSPGNPTGAVFPVEIVAAIGALAERTGVYIISDEIYEDIVFDGRRHVSFLDHTPTDRVFVIGGASKSYAMTGWRLGWLICPQAAATLASKLQEPVVSCAPSPSQAAAEAALAGTQAVVEAGRRLFERRRDLFLEILGPTGAIAARPGGAFYGLVRIGDNAESALAFAKRLPVIRSGPARRARCGSPSRSTTPTSMPGSIASAPFSGASTAARREVALITSSCGGHGACHRPFWRHLRDLPPALEHQILCVPKTSTV
jgi:DNA-binding transcriptional MocR family regulator